jgi:ATP-dependent helicase/nuclease subunit B
VFERETQDVIADLELFLRGECETDPSRTAIGFEVSFGKALDSSESEPLAQEAPIIVDLGHGLRFRLRGQIDRIEQIDTDSFEIIDYKTGGYWADSWKGTFAGGELLQHALYGLAAVELLKRRYRKAKVVAGGYYFPSVKGRQERKVIPRPSTEALVKVLADLRQVIAEGTFVHVADECKWCHFANACGENVFAHATAKKDDPKLAAYRRLVAHE